MIVGCEQVQMVGDACVPYTHRNGFGQTWTDCNPDDGFSFFGAMTACQLYVQANGGSGTCTMANCGSIPAVSVTVNGTTVTWDYGDNENGNDYAFSVAGNAAVCPTQTGTGGWTGVIWGP
jgi:hypothetical protein